MAFFTRHEQRILILLGIVMLLGTGLLLVKRFQPGWAMRLSMGEPDFDVEKDEVSPRLRNDNVVQKPGSDQVDTDDTIVSVKSEGQDQQSEQSAKEDESVVTEASDQDESSASKPKILSQTAKININTASKEELEALSRIGPTLAQRIIDHRQRYGKFTSIDGLTSVDGIGDKTLQRLKEQITVAEHKGSE
jgi:comEA protein